MRDPEIRLVGDDIEGAEDHFLTGKIPVKLLTAANFVARQKLGDDYLPDPSNLEIDPTMIVDTPGFVINAWHETAAPEGMAGIVQKHSFLLQMGYISGEHGSLVAEEVLVPLTTREFVSMMQLGSVAIMREANSLDEEPPESPYE